MSKRGLPTGIKMRHDAHYVEELATHHPTPIGRLIALDQLDPNPEQPRVEIGDLNDLSTLRFAWVRLPPAPQRLRGVLPRRWVAGRTFSWLGQSRRLAKEYARLCATSEAYIYAAMSRLMPRRLARA